MLIFSCGIIQSLIRQERIIFTGCGLTRNYPFLTKSLKKTQNRHGYQNVRIRKPRSEAMISTEFNCVRTESANVYFRVRFKVDDLTRLVESQRSQVSGRSVQKYMVISHMDGHTRVYCLEPNRIKCSLFNVSDLFQRGRSLDSN